MNHSNSNDFNIPASHDVFQFNNGLNSMAQMIETIETKPLPSERQEVMMRQSNATAPLPGTSEPMQQIVPNPYPNSSTIQQCLKEAMAPSAERNQIQDNVTLIKYNCPSEPFFQKCGDFLGMKFSREDYCKFVQRIKITQIKSNSKPTPTPSKNGFSSLSIFFTGNESQTSLIQKQINNYFVEKADNENQVLDLTGLTIQHLEIIADWWKCKMILYSSNGIWNKLGNWDSEETSLLVLKESKAQNFEIVFSLEGDE